MPVCRLCKTTYFRASLGGPAEPCDCGQNATADDVRRLRQDAVDSGSSDDPRDEREAV